MTTDRGPSVKYVQKVHSKLLELILTKRKT